MRSIQIATGEIYHIFNRGVDKRIIFQKDEDYHRFYSDLFLYNDKDFFHPGGKMFDREKIITEQISNPENRAPYVKILSYCFLPNHFHLLLEQILDDGITKIMHRIAMGYATYFNTKYKRTGRLFEGTFKAVHVKRDAQLEHLPRYIHLNVLDLTPLQWREGKIRNWGTAMTKLNRYRWSSHNQYIGKKEAIPLVDYNFIQTQFFDTKEYWSFLRQWSARIPQDLELADKYQGDAS